MVDLKGKAPETPSSKLQKRKKKIKASTEGALKKAKLLAYAMPAVAMTKVYFKLLYQFMLRLKVQNILHRLNLSAFISL